MVEMAGVLEEGMIVVGVLGLLQRGRLGVDGALWRADTAEDAAPGADIGVDVELARALKIGQVDMQLFRHGDQRNDMPDSMRPWISLAPVMQMLTWPPTVAELSSAPPL